MFVTLTFVWVLYEARDHQCDIGGGDRIFRDLDRQIINQIDSFVCVEGMCVWTGECTGVREVIRGRDRDIISCSVWR